MFRDDKEYQVEDWYWIVAGDETKVFSSLSRSFVSIEDKKYLKFLEEGGFETWIDTIANLKDVINEPVKAQLKELDIRSIRAIREKDDIRIASREAEAVILRAELLI